MKNYLFFAVLSLLAGCSTLPPLSEGVTLSVRSYDPATGDYVLELRNTTARPILFLNPYVECHTIRSPDPEPFPYSLGEMGFMVHSAKLAPGGSKLLSGTCTAGGTSSRPETYVAVRVCWFEKAWNCEQYLPIWSETPLNGAWLTGLPSFKRSAPVERTAGPVFLRHVRGITPPE